MKFDINIVRELLEAIEESDCYPRRLVHTLKESHISILDPSVSRREIAYHLERMLEAGLVVGEAQRGAINFTLYIEALTIEGHNLLNDMRCDTVWKKFCDKLESFKSFSIPVAQVLLAEYAKTAVLGS